MYVHRRPTMQTAIWLILTASILFAFNAAIGGVEWQRPALDGNSAEYSFAIAFTTQMLFWLVMPVAIGMLTSFREQAIHRCWTIAFGALVLYCVVAYFADAIFGFSEVGLQAKRIVLSALFGPLLAADGPSMLVASAFGLLMLGVIWLGSFIMAVGKIIGSLQEK